MRLIIVVIAFFPSGYGAMAEVSTLVDAVTEALVSQHDETVGQSTAVD